MGTVMGIARIWKNTTALRQAALLELASAAAGARVVASYFGRRVDGRRRRGAGRVEPREDIERRIRGNDVLGIEVVVEVIRFGERGLSPIDRLGIVEPEPVGDLRRIRIRFARCDPLDVVFVDEAAVGQYLQRFLVGGTGEAQEIFGGAGSKFDLGAAESDVAQMSL